MEIVLTGTGMLKPIRRLANFYWALTLEDGKTCVGLAFQRRLSYLFAQPFAKTQ